MAKDLREFQSQETPTETPTFENVKEKAWSPYENNGGTVIACAGKDFCIVASDTRLSNGYSILTRTGVKIVKLTNKCVLATSGFFGDIVTLHKTLKIRLEMYEHQNGKPMSTTAIAQLLSNTLYYKRFFPYYCFNVVGGIDENGLGCAYSYDAIGSFERVVYSSSGTGQQLVQPVLDNVIGKKNQVAVAHGDLSRKEVEDIVKDAFTSAGERDIYTGDFVDIFTIARDGVIPQKFELKFD